MRLRRLAWLGPFVLILVAGCGGVNELDSPTAAKLKALGNFYLEHAASHGKRGPADEKEFKKHLRGAPDFILKNYGLDPDNIDAAFMSERDQEPFVVFYGQGIGSVSGHSAPLVAHEKTGKNGRRLVAFANGKVDLVDDARLEELKTPKK